MSLIYQFPWTCWTCDKIWNQHNLNLMQGLVNITDSSRRMVLILLILKRSSKISLSRTWTKDIKNRNKYHKAFYPTLRKPSQLNLQLVLLLFLSSKKKKAIKVNTIYQLGNIICLLEKNNPKYNITLENRYYIYLWETAANLIQQTQDQSVQATAAQSFSQVVCVKDTLSNVSSQFSGRIWFDGNFAAVSCEVTILVDSNVKGMGMIMVREMHWCIKVLLILVQSSVRIHYICTICSNC